MLYLKLKYFRRFILAAFVLAAIVSVFPVYSQEQFVIGEFTVQKILDGDSFRFEGLDRSTRLLGIDTEETFKDSDAEIKVNDISGRWFEYYAAKKDSSDKPAKIESPFGYGTWQWTKELFEDVEKVRLEFDDLKRVIDIYNRYLVYVIAIRKDGTEFNYNIECVTRGYSPYFSKYGYSARFHDEFVKAQKYAQDKKLGIWSGIELCYPDYPERLLWWDKRANQIRRFETLYMGKPGYYSLLDMSSFNKLKLRVGDTVSVFGSITKVITDNDPNLVKFDLSDEAQFDLVFFNRNTHLIDELKLNEPVGYYVYAKGELSEYKGKLQIIVEEKEQVWEE
jgi:endonuclease YncB( thermonuclease family)